MIGQLVARLRFLVFVACALGVAAVPAGYAAEAPAPLLEKGKSVDWWFVYKFNAATGKTCGPADASAKRACPFGGKGAKYGNSQQFAVASSADSSLKEGDGCAGTSDPVAATFDQIYNGRFHYLIWNDQFYTDPKVPACSGASCGGPWGHSKGVLAWNDDGEGVVIQVTTPSWPGSGHKGFDRKSGNTLGCITKPNNIQNAQHFFALKLTKSDLAIVLRALANASVVTDIDNKQLVSTGGPADIKKLVSELGEKSKSKDIINEKLSTGITLVSKPSAVNAPPWQMLSSVLGGVNLRTATWWASPQIPTTNGAKRPGCWDAALTNDPGAVEIALTGKWKGKDIGLIGGQNHAKVGVSASGSQSLAIFGDLNQQGSVTGNCKSSQNGRGGLFYVLNDKPLFTDMTKLLDGKTASTTLPKKKKATAAKKKKKKA